ncbi:MAG: M28 family peptidase [Proteobacteria bacterium]|nr:M28 family peptidase [Pseudomonadota bacterium]
MKLPVLFAVALSAAAFLPAHHAPQAARPAVCAACVKANMQKLAGDDLRGRGCGTDDEHAAARFIAERLKRYGVAAGVNGYLMPVELTTPTAAAPATLKVVAGGGASVELIQGRDMAAMEPPPSLRGPLVRLTDPHVAPEAVKGRVVAYDSPIYDPPGVQSLLRAGAAAVIAPASDQVLEHWDDLSARPPGRTQVAGVERRAGPARGVAIFAKAEAMAALRKLDGGEATLSAPQGPPKTRTTYAVLGVLHGKSPDADRRAVLLSAHYDHLGVRNGVTFHGADDDASGTAAVLEFARILGAGARPKRTAYFALFGCEEEGGLAAQAFMAHPSMALSDLAANLEFEMIGVDDPKHPGFLMLTGWERSNLGPTLAAHGARIVADPYPEQNFFQRSDNYQLALKGVVAQTISAWPIPPTYHDATDDLAHVDLKLMDQVIGSMVEPVTWLLNSDFQPAWNPGEKP